MFVVVMFYDVGYFGVNNIFFVNCKFAEAERWNDVSVNENGYLFIVFLLFKKYVVLVKFIDFE